jgi:octanoyl-[GcvH]:protein N-octanoyltransferase
VQLITEGHPADPVLDMAVTHALLRRVGAGELPDVARVFVPGPTLAFSRLDALRDGFPVARAAAAAHGWTPVVRLGGGHAAAYGGGAVVVELITRTEGVGFGIQERFAAGTELIVAALAGAGVGVETGELPREYCPGRWSIHLPGGPKIAGAAQRNIRGASLFATALVVTGGARLREGLVAVYDALALDWDPATAGAIDDGVPGVRIGDVAAAVTATLAARRGPLTRGALDPATLALAEELRAGHVA